MKRLKSFTAPARIVVHITRVHTGVGDAGKTQLLDGTEVSKDDSRVIAIGDLDEANSWIGYARMEVHRMRDNHRDGGPRAVVRAIKSRMLPALDSRLNELFDIGSEISAPLGEFPESIIVLPQEVADSLITEMDEMLEDLEPLNSFILPTGLAPVAALQVGRAVVRRSERSIAALEGTRPEIRSYINRLSDWMFVCARWITKTLGDKEALWIPFGQG